MYLPRNVQTLSPPTTSINPGNQPAASLTITDAATILIYREYGSGSLPEWLDSLQIPRNVESLQQVKELWEISAMNFVSGQLCYAQSSFTKSWKKLFFV